MEVYVLFSGSKRVTLRPEDMSMEKISVIFQVQKETVYLTDDSNVAIFPRPDGIFNSFELNQRGHYEVHGDSTTVEKSPGAFQAGPPVRFSFHRTPSAAVSSSCSMPRSTPTKTFVRNVFYTEVLNEEMQTRKMVTVRFTEFEACVATVTSKVNEALGQLESNILTDIHGNEILDSEGTGGSAYWKQNSRKVFAVPEEQRDLLQVNKRRRLSRREDTGLKEVAVQIEEVVEAAQGLQDVSRIIKDLTGSAQSTLTTILPLSEAEVATMKGAFCCLICKGPLDKPMFASCCRSLIGCEFCILEWMKGNSHCPKCRAIDAEDGIHKVAGLCEALAPLRKLLL